MQQIINIVLIVIIGILICAGAIFVLGPMFRGQSDMEVVARQFSAYKNASIGQYNRLKDYTAICSGVLPPEPVVCRDSAAGYVMTQTLSNGQTYCLDSAGYIGIARSTSVDPPRCVE